MSAHNYFFRSELSAQASLVIGLPRLVPDVRGEVISTIADYSKTNDFLDLPNPYDLFDMNVVLSMVRWEEHRRFKKTSRYWEQALGNCVLLETLCAPTVVPVAKPPEDLSFNRPVQGHFYQRTKPDSI